MREPSKDKFRLQHIMEAIERLEIHAGALTKEELVSDVMRYYGIVKNIEIIGEAARMLSNEFKNSHTEIPFCIWNTKKVCKSQILYIKL